MGKKYGRLIVGLSIIGITAFLYSRFDLNRFTNLEEIRSWVAMFGPLGPLAFIFICITGLSCIFPKLS